MIVSKETRLPQVMELFVFLERFNTNKFCMGISLAELAKTPFRTISKIPFHSKFIGRSFFFCFDIVGTQYSHICFGNNLASFRFINNP